MRVLLAEDNAVNRLLATRLLQQRGHHVTAVQDGCEALEALARERFDLVLMDVQMPRLDGVEASQRIRSGELAGVPKDIPIVALTAHAMDGDRERLLAAGMDEYLSKPLEREGLERVLKRVAERIA